MRPDRWTAEKHERFTAEGWWPDRTILEHVREGAERHPDRDALVDERGRYTYGDLPGVVDNLALGLRAHGVEPDDVVAHQIPNRNEGALLHLACLRAGAVPNPIVSIYRESEVSYMVDKLESVAYAAPAEHRGFDHRGMALDIREDSALETVFVLDSDGEDDTEGAVAFDDLLSTDWEAEGMDPTVLEAAELGPNEFALAQFTSGTTGQPKGVMHTENTLLAAQNGQIDRLGLTDDDVIFTPSPIGHLTGIQHGYRLALMLGVPCVFQRQWDAETAASWIEREGATYFAGATPFVRDLALLDDLEAYDTSTLRLIMTAGAPVPEEVTRRAHENLGVTVCRGWGQTENTLPTLNAPDDPEEKLLHTDGAPYGGMEVRIREPGALEDALPGEEGELQVRGPFNFLGYYEDEERTAESFTDDGWFKTGDKAVVDEDGHVTIKGRIKDIIIRGGENIPVREIEEYLHQHPKVADGAIVAMPDERLQERACAYVLPADPADPLTFEEMVDYLDEQGIATQKLPERLEIVEELPMTASGKIQRYKLREDIADKLGMEPVTR